MLHSDTRLPGYGPSAFGGFDHALTRDLEIATYRALVRLDPIEPHFTYSLAGSLMRCLAFDEAESLYAALIGRDPPFEAARLTLAMFDWQRGRKEEAQGHIDAFNQASIAAGAKPWITLESVATMPQLTPEQRAQSTCR
jgi:hypothetical protein